jgi:hypothetical protein
MLLVAFAKLTLTPKYIYLINRHLLTNVLHDWGNKGLIYIECVISCVSQTKSESKIDIKESLLFV